MARKPTHKELELRVKESNRPLNASRKRMLIVMAHNDNGEFTSAAITINILAGALFLAAVLRFMLDFHRSGSLEAYLFACMSLLFGLSGLTFQYSSIWDNGWWTWHLLRLISYLLVLGFMVRQYLQVVSDLKLTIAERKQAEEALRESEQKYRTILESIEESYFEVDIAGNFTFFNDSLSKSLGYSNDELMGMNNRDYMTPESLIVTLHCPHPSPVM